MQSSTGLDLCTMESDEDCRMKGEDRIVCVADNVVIFILSPGIFEILAMAKLGQQHVLCRYLL